MNLFAPDYGAASSHIAELVKEREDFVLASRSQSTRISALEKQVSVLSEDLQAAHEQLEVTRLISESRMRQLEQQNTAAEAARAKMDRMRSAVYTLWGLMQEQQMRVREQEGAVKAGSELLESLSEMLAEPKSRDEPTNVESEQTKSTS